MSSIAAETPVDVPALLRRLKFPAAITIIGLALVTVLALIGQQGHNHQLDPRDTLPDGAHALSVLLTERGIAVSALSATSDIKTGANTVLVTEPDELSRAALHDLAASTASVVLIDPSASTLQAIGVSASPDAETPAADSLEPNCSLPIAVAAGSVRVSGDLYRTAAGSAHCYLQQGDAALVQVERRNGGTTTIFGSPSTLSNAQLGNDGDAALALGLLNTPTVQWVTQPLDAGAATGSKRGLFNLLPARLLWATLQLFIAVIVVALWRGRRLGAPVVEPLPIIVRAAETVEGRGRLMRAARSRGLAANALRAATIRRLSTALRLGSTDDRSAVVGLVAERTTMSATEVEAVLYGGDPPDDAALVALAQRLPSIETAVRQDATPAPNAAAPAPGGHG